MQPELKPNIPRSHVQSTGKRKKSSSCSSTSSMRKVFNRNQSRRKSNDNSVCSSGSSYRSHNKRKDLASGKGVRLKGKKNSKGSNSINESLRKGNHSIGEASELDSDDSNYEKHANRKRIRTETKIKLKFDHQKNSHSKQIDNQNSYGDQMFRMNSGNNAENKSVSHISEKIHEIPELPSKSAQKPKSQMRLKRTQNISEMGYLNLPKQSSQNKTQFVSATKSGIEERMKAESDIIK